ncbi:glycosyltransferase family 2 protein [Candidatus Babeliales bacterium]|nr:glycosyltransferase family 2 protein [Candidatus Babeliales bacterium]
MIYLILPIYNEEKSIRSLLEKIDSIMKKNDLSYKILAVNDGSSDATRMILEGYSEKISLNIINHKYNRGLGETVRDGFEWIAEVSKPDDIIVRMDADDTHEPKYIPKMIEKINNGFDIAIASRFQKGGGQKGVSLYRSIMSIGANILMKIFFPIKGVRDYTCGFRAYRAEAIKNALYVFGNDFVELKGLGFTTTLEKLIKLKRLGAKIVEVPFELKYDQKLSQSRINSKITILGYLILILKGLYPWRWAKITRGWLKKIEEVKNKK